MPLLRFTDSGFPFPFVFAAATAVRNWPEILLSRIQGFLLSLLADCFYGLDAITLMLG